jgi:hypothetical protein
MATIESRLRKHRLPGIKLHAKPAKTRLAVGRSKLGGHPDLPADFVWPAATRAGNGKSLTAAPLSFIGQIALADVARLDRDHLLPSAGWLLFFTLDAMRVYRAIGVVKKKGRSAPVETATVVVHLAKGTKLARRAPPADLPPSCIGPEVSLAFSKVDTWPQVEGVVVGDPGKGIVKLSKADWQSWAEDGEQPPRQGMLGHAYGCEYPIGMDPTSRLLLSVDVKESGLPWDLFGRNGFLFFHAPEAAVRAGRWDEAQHREW